MSILHSLIWMTFIIYCFFAVIVLRRQQRKETVNLLETLRVSRKELREKKGMMFSLKIDISKSPIGGVHRRRRLGIEWRAVTKLDGLCQEKGKVEPNLTSSASQKFRWL